MFSRRTPRPAGGDSVQALGFKPLAMATEEVLLGMNVGIDERLTTP
jgi:hypothetical protein